MDKNKKRLESCGAIRYLCEPTRMTVRLVGGKYGAIELRTTVNGCSDEQLEDVATLLLDSGEVFKALCAPLYGEQSEAKLAGPEVTEKLVFARVYESVLFCGMPGTVKVAEIIAKRARSFHEEWQKVGTVKAARNRDFLLFAEAA